MVKIHTFHCKYMTQYTPALLDIPLNETPSTLKPCHLITGIPNFIENACNVSVISTIGGGSPAHHIRIETTSIEVLNTVVTTQF